MQNLPNIMRIREPIMQELYAVGGTDDVRFLYQRLVAYFPNLDREILEGESFNKWRLAIQRAGRDLDRDGLIRREKGLWSLTAGGEKRLIAEIAEFPFQNNSHGAKGDNASLSHGDVQEILQNIGKILNYHTQKEFEFYDVIWRVSKNSPRLSHVFEVQSRGNLDSALTKLKRAFEMQRSKIFLVLTHENDVRRVANSLQREFYDLEKELNVLTFQQVKLVHNSLESIAPILPKLLMS